MSKIIDLITTLVGVGVVAYFGYTVILPKLNTQLPQLQLPSSTPITELPSVISSPSTRADDDDDKPSQSPPKRSTTSSAAAPSPSTFAPSTGGGQVIYDSNKAWSGVTTAASGNPKWSAETGGIGKLSCGAGHCRVYIAVKNHNARMEGEFMFTGSVENISLRLRSRHGESGGCENRFGGFGVAAYPSGERKLQTESCHNNHENTIGGKGIPLKAGTWYKLAYSCYDSPDKKSVNFKLDVNGKTEITGKHSSPKPYYMDEALHQKMSYIWIRSNNNGSGTVSVRNFKVYNLGKGGAASLHAQSFTMQEKPYLFNRFYHGRRM